MRKQNFIFVFSLIVLILLSASSPSEAVGIIRIDQAKIRLSISPGSSKAGTIKIDNPTEYPKQIKAYLEDWYYLPSADGSKEFKPAGTTEFSSANWITFVPAEFTLPPFGKQLINYTVRVPEDATGGHYAILFFEHSAPNESKEGVGVGVAIRVGCLIYIEAEGTIKRSTQLDNLSLQRNANDGLLKINLGFKNTGNVDLTVGGNFDIIDRKGMVFARGALNDIYTSAGAQATLSGAWSQPIPKGEYDLVLTIDLGKALEEMNMGRGPVIVKESEIEIGTKGEIVRVGDLK